jgi:hypothetical protein
LEKWAEDLPNDGTCTGGRCAVGFEALHRTIAAVREGGGAYVLVNVPEHPARWRGPGAEERYRQYIEALRAFAAAERVGFIDPTDGNPLAFAETPFNDFAHMTAAGARQFTCNLADRMTSILEAAVPLRGGLHAAARGGSPAVPKPASASGRHGHD